MYRTVLTLAALVMAGLVAGLVGGQTPPAQSTPPAPPAGNQAQAIRDTVAAYCAAFNKGDVQARRRVHR